MRRCRCHFCASLERGQGPSQPAGRPYAAASLHSAARIFRRSLASASRWPLNLFFSPFFFFPKRAGDACQAWIPAAPNHKLSAPRLGGEPGQKPTEKAFLAAHGLVSQKNSDHRTQSDQGQRIAHAPSNSITVYHHQPTLNPPSQSIIPTTRSHILSVSIHSPHQANLCSTPVVDPICVLHRKSPPPVGPVLCASSDHVCSCLLMPTVLYDLRPAAFAWDNCFSSWTPPTVLLNPRISLQHTILNALSHRTTYNELGLSCQPPAVANP